MVYLSVIFNLIITSVGFLVRLMFISCYYYESNQYIMSHLFLESSLIIKINEISNVPFPLAKYTLSQWILHLQHRPNHYSHHTISRYFEQEGAKIDHREVTATVEYLFRSAKKSALSPKQLNTLLNENTVLPSEHVEHLLALYASFLEDDGGSQISGSAYEDLQWSAISLRQTQDKQQPNKLYMKLQVTTQSQGGQARRTMNMSLLEFKLMLQEVNKVQSLVNV